jgi:predicted ATPase
MEKMPVVGLCRIGKTALVYEFQKAIVETSWYFITGNFEQFKQNTPFFSSNSGFTMLAATITDRK